MNFYKKYLIKCAEKNESPSAAALNAGLAKTSVNRWKNGSTPTDATILRLALYFGCSPDDLAPDTEPGEEKSPSPKSEELINGDPELTEYLEELSTRSEMRMLFHVTKNATKEQIEAIVRMVESMRD